MKKYFFDLSIICLSVAVSFFLTGVHKDTVDRTDTIIALKAIKKDLRHDTLMYDAIRPRLEESVPVLSPINSKLIPT